MTRLPVILMVFAFLQTTSIIAQKSSEFLPDKPGKWSFSSNIKTPSAEVAAFNKNLATLAEWFHQNTPMLKNPKGYDLDAWVYDISGDTYKLNKCNYAMRAEVDFNFQLFLSEGGKWTIEPPHFEFYVNNTEGGHAANPATHLFDAEYYNYTHQELKYKFSQSDEKAINDIVVKMNGIFAVFPLVKELARGVNLYNCESGECGSVVVFKPERPDFWIPVTLRELANINLEYYTRTKDDFLLPQLQKEIAELTEEELNAPAYEGHDTHFVLKANGKNEGFQLMRFNPDYWDRSLPPSAIQFMTFWYPQKDETAMDESYKNNGHPSYSQFLVNEFDWEKLAGFIQR